MAQVPVWQDEPVHASALSADNFNALSNAIAPRTVTTVIAASNSTANGKLSADYVCSGSGDETTINAAIAALPSSGGRVVLLEGAYTCTNAIVIDKNFVTLQGQGLGFNTVIGVPSGTVNRPAAIIAGSTQRITHTVIRDLSLNVGGGTSAVKAGTGHGIVIASDNHFLDNVIIQYCSGDAFHYGFDLLNPAVQTTIALGSNNQSLAASLSSPATINVVSTSGFPVASALMVRKASGAVAYVTYTGTTGTTFTGCKGNWGGTASDFLLSTGDVVFWGPDSYNGTTYNCFADNYGSNGFYIDWNYGSCEWILARANGLNVGKPTSSTGAQNGFLVYGSFLKFNMCHPYNNAGAGMKIGDNSSFISANIIVNGGEYESNTDAGILVRENVGPITITGGAQFYGQGLASAPTVGSDIFLSFNSKDVTIAECVFTKGTLGNITKQIYAFQSTRCKITDCSFNYPSDIQNIFLDGAAGPCSYFVVRNNQVINGNAGSRAVYLIGNTTLCLIEGNVSDAGFQEVISGSTPNNNTFINNVLVPGQSASITTVGPNTRVIPLGSAGTVGLATLAAGTVTVSTTVVTATSRIFLTAQSTGGTAGALRVSARTAGTSFTITSTSGTDTSTVAWMCIEPA